EGTGDYYGLGVLVSWSSDSGVVSDLGQLQILEKVEFDRNTWTGVFVEATPHTGPWVSGDGTSVDRHGVPKAAITDLGHLVAWQTHVFRDQRTGASGMPAAGSGFRVHDNSRHYPGCGWRTASQNHKMWCRCDGRGCLL